MVERDEATALLQRGPAVLRAMYSDLPTVWLHAAVPGEWSAHTVLVHLLRTEDHAWVDRIAHLLLSPGSVLPPVDPGGPDGDRDVAEMLDRFDELRRSNLERLTELDARTERGNHHLLGEVTTDQILATWAVHDLNHQAQAMAAMASRYRDAVGPFIPNLGILGPPR